MTTLLRAQGLWLALLLVLLLVSWKGGVEATPQISTTNILLPPFPNIAHYVQLTKGCWIVRSSSASESDDDLVDVIPAEPRATVECVVVVQPDDSECHKDFKIRVREAKRLGLRSILFVKMPDPEDHRQLEMRVDVRVAEIARLEILTTTRRVEVGEKEILQVIGRDADQNVFSSLSGIEFRWDVVRGNTFIELQTLSDANIAMTEEEATLDKTRQTALGLSTGRAQVSVQFPGHELEARVDLTVSRAISICPGPRVAVFPFTKLESMFCLNNLGCYSSSATWKARMPTSKDDYDFVNKQETFQTKGVYQVVAQDKNEPSNRATLQVHVGDLHSLTHHVASLEGTDQTADTPIDNECSFLKSRSTDWPALSKLLPARDAFKHNQPKYYLIKGSKYVFLGLARIDRDQAAVPPHVHETMKFSFEGAKDFLLDSLLHTTIVTPQKAGEYRVKMQFRTLTTEFTVVVSDPIYTIPAGALYFSPDCKTTLEVRGGSGSYRSRYRATMLPKHSQSSLLQIHNWTTLQSRPGTEIERGELRIWDELDQSNRVSLNFTTRSFDLLRLQERYIYVMEGSEFSLSVQAETRSGSIFACCKLDMEGIWKEQPLEFGMDTILNFVDAHTQQESINGQICTSGNFYASKVGTTRVRYISSNMQETDFAYVTVYPRLRLDPEVAALPVGSRVIVNILGGPIPAEITVDGESSSSRQFIAECTQSGTKVFNVKSQNEHVSDRADFTLSCVTPTHCSVETFSEDWTPINATIMAENTVIRIIPSVYDDSKQNLSVIAAAKVFVKEETITGSMLTVRKDITITAERLKYRCQKDIHVRPPLQVFPSQSTLWYWNACPVNFRLLHGSGSFMANANPTRDRDVVIYPYSNERFQRVVFKDLNFYPTQPISKSLSFQPLTSISLKQEPEYIVQHSSFSLTLQPMPHPSSLATITSLQSEFDWSPYSLEHSALEWEPVDMLSLTSKDDVKTFKLQALREGNVTLNWRLCSYCDPSKCLESSMVLTIEKYKSIAIFPGAQYDLSSCAEELGDLSECVVMDRSPKTELTAFSNGTVIAGCTSGEKSLVQCTSSHMRREVHFYVSVQSPEQLSIYPNTSSWLLSTNHSFQVHASLIQEETDTCAFKSADRRVDYWEFSSGLESFSLVSRVESMVVKSNKGVASALITPNAKGMWRVGVKVKLGQVNATCRSLVKSRELSAFRKWKVHEPVKLLSPSRLLLPPGSRYNIQVQPAAAACSIGSCGCEDFSILPKSCIIQVAAFPKSKSSICAITISPFEPTASNSALPFEVVLVETRSISSISSAITSDTGAAQSVSIKFHDEYSRTFTAGWYDDSQTLRRTIKFHPDLLVVVSSPTLSGNQINITSGRALESVHISAFNKKWRDRSKFILPSLIVDLSENDKLVSRSLIERIERICNNPFLFGLICLDNSVMSFALVAATVTIAAGVIGQRGQRPYDYILLLGALVTVYFVVF